MPAKFRVGLIGLGHVGGVVARRLTEGPSISEAAGRPVVLVGVAVARPQGRTAPAPLVSADALMADKSLDALIEVAGGLEPARSLLERGLSRGLQVITANKQVIAAHGPALARLGRLRFEASVASAVPIVETLADDLAADTITGISGILNGTTNMLLEAMAGGREFGTALAEAQAAGLAEADPSADVDAHDPAAKLAILVMLAFHRRIDVAAIPRVGIRGITSQELSAARGRGRVIKLIAAARAVASGIEADVRPRSLPTAEPLSRVGGALNGIRVDAQAAGPLFFQGAGAGPEAAASAVIADLIRAARDAPAMAGAALARLAGAPLTPVGSWPPGEPFPSVP
ncbi:MAG: homoserine dehydrogenase [Chloroflexi bacterium]|nr:MAG: homoserine dehydrogenase [Chloroflexota bacterium]